MSGCSLFNIHNQHHDRDRYNYPQWKTQISHDINPHSNQNEPGTSFHTSYESIHTSYESIHTKDDNHSHHTRTYLITLFTRLVDGGDIRGRDGFIVGDQHSYGWRKGEERIKNSRIFSGKSMVCERMFIIQYTQHHTQPFHQPLQPSHTQYSQQATSAKGATTFHRQQTTG